MGRSLPIYLILTVSALACRPADDPAEGPQPVVPESLEVSKELDADDPTILKRPFTAEEIRDEMVEGFTVVVRRSYPEGMRLERWTVVAADEEGVEIEYATVAEDNALVDEPSTARSSWIELRDHATFAADASTREWTSRSTALGDLEGWLYRVEKNGGTVQEFFFVPALPGAPVLMRILDGGDVVIELEQMERVRPEVP